MLEIISIESIEKHLRKPRCEAVKKKTCKSPSSVRPGIKDPGFQKEVFCELLKHDGLDSLSELKRCGFDPDTMAKDQDDNAKPKKFRCDNEDNCSMGGWGPLNART